MNRVQTVLIVDDDLGFVWWLGSMFAEIGCHAVPAVNCAQALDFVAKFELQIDLLIAKPTLSGLSQLIRSLGKPDLKTVAIVDDTMFAPDDLVRSYDKILTRPSSREPISRREWQRKLQTLLKTLSLTCVSEVARRV